VCLDRSSPLLGPTKPDPPISPPIFPRLSRISSISAVEDMAIDIKQGFEALTKVTPDDETDEVIRADEHMVIVNGWRK
jgi:hypothetical protein